MLWVVPAEQRLAQQSVTPRDVLDGFQSEWSPCVMHLWANLSHSQTIGENLADVGYVLNGHSEGDRHVQVYRTNMVALRQHLPTEFLTQIPKVGASALHRIVVEEFSLSDFAELDDETSDSLEGKAGDGLSDQLMVWSIGVGSEFEIVHVTGSLWLRKPSSALRT